MYQSHSTTGAHTRMRALMLVIASFLVLSVLPAQEVQYTPPVWRFGGAAAANLNFYGGTTQMLNSGLTVPSAFHKGFGAGIYLAPMIEYRPNTTWGGMLQLGYDDRRAAFVDVPCPCGENSSLNATISYLSLEPSIRFSPFSDAFFIFGGPRIAYNFSLSSPDEKTFLFIHEGKTTTQSQFSDMNDILISGQIGIGYAIDLSSSNDETQWELSPFITYQPFFGQDPRSVESWGVSTVRVGATLTFGSGKAIAQEAEPTAAVIEREVPFTVRVPKAVPVKRRVRETFPLRNYIFFEEGSSEIPMRYDQLTKQEASVFTEAQLQEVQPKSMAGRSQRQMTVYYNILNIVGDRMKRNPKTTIRLSGSSDRGEAYGLERAESVKRYLVTIFGIDSTRIETEGRIKPKFPSESTGGTKELALLLEGDRRVDIESTSPEIMVQVGGPSRISMKPVQVVLVEEDPLDSQILFTMPGAHETMASWSVEITDSLGAVQHFGPSTRDQENISGNAVLGDRPQGSYTVTMLGQTKKGRTVRSDTTIHLIRRELPKNDIVRYRILFDFDQSKTVAMYETFLTDVVSPLIPDSSNVIIHGYTDIIGEEAYNENLSNERVQDARGIIQRAISKLGKRAVTFETFGFGEDPQYSAFDNYFPEQRFYNRSVVIDIVPE